MAREFMWIKPDGTWSTRRPIGEVMDKAGEACEHGLKSYTLLKNGKKVRSGQRRWVLRGLRRELEQGRVGNVFDIWGKDKGGEHLFKCREVEPALHVTNTNGNKHADYCWSFGKAKYGDCTFLGAYVCKRIVGSYTMSQHSYGNAVDFGRDNMDELWDLAHYVVSNADKLHVQHVIVSNRIWTRGSGWGYYGGQYHYHVHVDFDPQYSGGCGVRG